MKSRIQQEEVCVGLRDSQGKGHEVGLEEPGCEGFRLALS